MIYEHRSYRTYLREVLAERTERNPSYSLRSMAQAIGISAALLSDLLNGKRNLTLPTAQKISESLKLDERSTEYLLALSQYESAKDASVRDTLYRRIEMLRPSSTQVHDLSIDAFRVLSTWYHFPILQMFQLSDVQVNSKFAAEYLGIKEIEAQAALDRLERLELITRDEAGIYQQLHSSTFFESARPEEALKKYHQEMLARTADNLDWQTNDEKFIGTETFAFHQKDLDKAKNILNRCFDELTDLAQNQTSKNHIYHLGIQLTRLQKRSRRTGEKNEK